MHFIYNSWLSNVMMSNLRGSEKQKWLVIDKSQKPRYFKKSLVFTLCRRFLFLWIIVLLPPLMFELSAIKVGSSMCTPKCDIKTAHFYTHTKKTVQKLLQKVEEQNVCNVSVLEWIYDMYKSWRHVTSDNIIHCFKKSGIWNIEASEVKMYSHTTYEILKNNKSTKQLVFLVKLPPIQKTTILTAWKW